jgi:cytoskeleton protein RodZ
MNEHSSDHTSLTHSLLLRQARESAGLHIAALAAALKVPVRKLEALEAGRYHELPDLTFARALAYSVCRHLKVDPAPILEQIPVGRAVDLGLPSQTINALYATSAAPPSAHFSGLLRRPALLIAVALIVAAGVLFYLPSQPVLQDPVPVPGAVSAENHRVLSQNAEGPSALVPAAVSDGASSEAPQVVPTTESATPALVAAITAVPMAVPPDAGVGAAMLALSVTADTWVEVIDGLGNHQVKRILNAGDVLSFPNSTHYSLVLGRADAVNVVVRGVPFDTAPFTRNSVARFQVK